MPPASHEPRTDVQVTVDLVIFTIREHQLHVLLIERGLPPFEGRWALPGGFIREGEGLEQAALRELEEETGVRGVYFEQLYTFGDPERDPRSRIVTVAYYALIAADDTPLVASTDARAARWWPVAKRPKLAFDHDRILDFAVKRLRSKLEYTDVGFELLPSRFTLTELQHVHEAILGRPLDKRNFRRKLALRGILKPVKKRRHEPGRPARLYVFSTGNSRSSRMRGSSFRSRDVGRYTKGGKHAAP